MRGLKKLLALVLAMLFLFALLAATIAPCRAWSWQPEARVYCDGVIEVSAGNEVKFVLAAYRESGQMLGAWTGRTKINSDCTDKVVVGEAAIEEASSWKLFFVDDDFTPLWRSKTFGKLMPQ